MNTPPNVERLSQLNLAGFSLGDDILFCPTCSWQAPEPQAMSPVCPECGVSLHISRIEKELQELCYSRRNIGLDESFFKTPFQKAIIARLKQADLGAAAIEMARASNPFGGAVPPIENEPPPRPEAER